MNSKGLDHVDQQTLNLLVESARAPLIEIAEQVGLSRAAVKNRIDALEKGWAKGWKARGWVKGDKKPALNPDLWEKLLHLCDYHTVHLHWVKGHAENPYNNRCDELAVMESKKFRG